MRSRRHHKQEPEEILFRLELLAMEKRIMAAIDDLNNTLDGASGDIATIATKVQALEAAQGTPEAQVAAAAAKAQSLRDQLTAIANS